MADHFQAAQNVPRAYHPVLAKSAVARTYALQLSDKDIDALIQTDPELHITPTEMRNIVHATIAARLDPYYRIAADEAWGYDDETDEPPEIDMQHLRNALFAKHGIENDAAPRPVGKLDPSRIRQMEDLRRHGNLQEAMDMDDAAQPTYNAPVVFEELNYAQEEREQEENRKAEERRREEEEKERARKEEEEKERARKEKEDEEKKRKEEEEEKQRANDDAAIEGEIEDILAPVPARDTAEERQQLTEAFTSTDAFSEFSEASSAPADETEQQQVIQEVNEVNAEAAALNAETTEIVKEEKELAREESFYKAEERELASEKKAADDEAAHATAEADRAAANAAAEAVAKQQAADEEALRKIAEEKARVEQKEKRLAEKRKRNAERAEKASRNLQSFLSRTKKDINEIDTTTGLSKKAKAEATKQMTAAVDTGIDKSITSVGNFIDKKLSSETVVDTIIANATKEDPVWKTIEPDDRRNLAKEAHVEVAKLEEQVAAKEANDIAQVNELVESKQISGRTGDRMKRVLHAQNLQALNIAVKSFAQSVGKKLGMSSKRFSALMKRLNAEGSKFRAVLERQIRDYAPVVKKVLRELSKDAAVIAKEANKIIGPMLKEYGPIIMDALGQAGSKATTEVLNQIPNVVGMVAKSATKTGKSAIGADIDAAKPAAELHSQWSGGSIAYAELLPTDPDNGVYMFPPALLPADVLHHLQKMSTEPGKSGVFWMIYLRLYMFLTQMSRESDDWLKWSCERAPLFLGASPIVLSSSDLPPAEEAVAWVHNYAGKPITALNVDMVRAFVDLVLRGCVALSSDCATHARILFRVPAAGIGYENLSLL